MKYLYAIIFIALICAVPAIGQKKMPIVVSVDRNVELATIIARLAEFEEFVNNNQATYAMDVDAYFSKFKDHEMIAFARKLRQENGIAYSQYLSLPVHLDPNLAPKVPFTATVPHRDFGKKNAEEFARLMKKFCKDTDCDKFFADHQALYRTATERYQAVVEKIDFPWFAKFYGEQPSGTFNIIVGLLAGGGNFGEKVVYSNGKTDLFAIMGATSADESGMPVFSAKAELPIVIHEFNHSFINHLIDANPKPFEAACSQVFKLVAMKMMRQAYQGWQTPLNESLVRAAVVRYIFEHEGIESANSEIIGEQGNGFVWMDELFTILGAYEGNRVRYPTFRSFLPFIAGYYGDLAKRAESKIESFTKMKPKILELAEFKNGATDVDPATKTITFTFSRALRGKGISINYGSLGQAGFPKWGKGVGSYSDNATKFTLRVELEPNREYEFVLTGNAFVSADGFPIDDYVVKFKTKSN